MNRIIDFRTRKDVENGGEKPTERKTPFTPNETLVTFLDEVREAVIAGELQDVCIAGWNRNIEANQMGIFVGADSSIQNIHSLIVATDMMRDGLLDCLVMEEVE